MILVLLDIKLVVVVIYICILYADASQWFRVGTAVLDEQDPHVWIFKRDRFIWFARMNYAEYSTIVAGGFQLGNGGIGASLRGNASFFGSRLFCYAKATAQMALLSAIKCSML